MQAIKRLVPFGIIAAVLALIAAIAAAPNQAGAADHLDAPGLTSPDGRAKVDINDLYVFPAKKDTRTAIAVTVSPVAGDSAKFATGFSKSYSIRVDLDGDAIEDMTYNIRFFGFDGARQFVLVQRARGKSAQSVRPVGKVKAVGLTDSTIRVRGGGKVYAGLRSDPFFFDLSGFLGTIEGIGGDALGADPTDFFVDLNTLAIVRELKDRELNDGGPIGVWATTQRKVKGVWTQVDRLGRPAINTVVNSSGPVIGAGADAKNVFNAGHPKDDVADFRAGVIDALLALSALDPIDGVYSPAEAGALADVLLPDILAFDKAGALPPPLNGRALADDVIDTELRILTGGDPLGLFPPRDADGGVNSDGVGPHDDYLKAFPYLGEPN